MGNIIRYVKVSIYLVWCFSERGYRLYGAPTEAGGFGYINEVWHHRQRS